MATKTWGGELNKRKNLVPLFLEVTNQKKDYFFHKSILLEKCK